ncbi:ABC transporter substrate-binding protein [Cohnella faecalis]|uniref:Extracellular solute-binding protein n=1 Tax=Cohnella faecalis TaxID=2315694 RepID=A0A398CJP7_9BACL|nr:extracellular solute-binding protein [Cohnella faecalis]RIE02575.1 extracellular solute-binding protein [Cohnella faecalis]
MSGRSKWIGGLAAVLLAAVVTGCANDKKVELDPETITVLVVDQGTSAAGVKVNELMEKSKAYTEEKNKGLTVNLVKVATDQYLDKIKELKPDVFWIPPSQYRDWDKEIGLLDLTPLMELKGVNVDDYFPESLSAITMDGDKRWGLPIAALNYSIGYSKIWFDNAGLAYPSEDWTWEEFAAAAAKLKEANRDRAPNGYGAMIPLYPDILEPLVLSRGGSLVSPDGTTAAGYLDGEPAAEVIDWLKKLIDDGTIPSLTFGPEMGTAFEKIGAETGMAVSSMPILIEHFKKSGHPDQFGIVNFPKFQDGVRANSPSVTAIAISKNSEHANAAWTYIYESTMEDNPVTREFFGLGLNLSKKVYEKLASTAEPYVSIGYRDLEFAQNGAAARLPEWPAAINANYAQWQSLFNDNADSRKTLKQLASNIDANLAAARTAAEETEPAGEETAAQ